MGSERAIDLLKSIGMSGYEAKAYVALVQAGRPLNGYEIAKASGVPRSTVYETLGKLVARGAAFEVNARSNATSYLALPPDTLVGRLRHELESTIDDLSSVLPALTAPATTHVVQHLQGADDVLAQALDVVDSATAALFMSVWPEELEVLRPALRRARQRHVEVSCIVFGAVDADVALLGRFYQHRFSNPDVVETRLGCRVFTVVADRDAVLVGAAENGATWGVWSDDPAVVLMAGEYVRHDIALQVIVERIGGSELENIWTTDSVLEYLRSTSGMRPMDAAG
jgi:HTH-type transcriptional regulator, sugar sensing transcriptional regulator